MAGGRSLENRVGSPLETERRVSGLASILRGPHSAQRMEDLSGMRYA